MANRWYEKGLQSIGSAALLGTQIDLVNDDIRALLVTSAYTPDTSATGDQFVSTISGIGGAILARSGSIASKTLTGGVWNFAAFTWSLVPTGHVGKYVVLYKFNASDAAAPLILIDDTGNNLPVTTDGGDLQYQPASTGNRVGHL